MDSSLTAFMIMFEQFCLDLKIPLTDFLHTFRLRADILTLLNEAENKPLCEQMWCVKHAM